MPDSTRMVSHGERMLALSQLDAFGGLSAEQLSYVANRVRERLFHKRETLFDEEQPIQALWLVLDGRVALDDEGRTVRVVRPGEYVGALALFAVRGGVERARALVPTLTLELPHDALRELLEDHFGVALAIIRTLARGLAAARREQGDERVFPTRDGRARVRRRVVTSQLATPSPQERRDLDLVQRLLYLRRGHIFLHASVDALAQLAKGAVERSFARGEVLWEAGARATSLMLVVDGELTVEDPDGAWLDRVRAYGVAGALDVLGGHPRSGRCEAAHATVALELAWEHLLDLLEDDFEMTQQLLSALSAELLDAQDTGSRVGPGGWA